MQPLRPAVVSVSHTANAGVPGGKVLRRWGCTSPAVERRGTVKISVVLRRVTPPVQRPVWRLNDPLPQSAPPDGTYLPGLDAVAVSIPPVFTRHTVGISRPSPLKKPAGSMRQGEYHHRMAKSSRLPDAESARVMAGNSSHMVASERPVSA